MTTKELINENVGLQCRISQVISDLVDARLYKDSHKEAECISRMETLLIGIEQHLQCTEGFLKESKSVEPKFKVGDKIVKKNVGCCAPLEITGVGGEYYYSNTPNSVDVLPIKDQDDWELVPNKFDITTLKPFDKVLVRDND